MGPLLPKAGKTKLGEYLPVTRESNPERFEAPGSSARRAAQAAAAMERLLFRTIYGGDAELAREGSADSEQLVVDADGDVGAQATAQARVDALDVDDAPWKRYQPKAQPLTYAIPTDNQGGRVYRQVAFNVDFNDVDSVERADKCRRQGLYRAGKRLGLPLKRASMQGRQFTVAEVNFIANAYDSYAASHGGRQIPPRDLYTAYSGQYGHLSRSQESLTSYLYLSPRLRAKKDSYRA